MVHTPRVPVGLVIQNAYIVIFVECIVFLPLFKSKTGAKIIMYIFPICLLF